VYPQLKEVFTPADAVLTGSRWPLVELRRFRGVDHWATIGVRGMKTDGGHPYGSLRLATLVMTLSLAVLVTLGASTPEPASASTSSVDSKSAGAIIAEARAAMIRAGSVRATGAGTASISGLGKATLTETDYSNGTSGSQVLTMASSRARPGQLPSATTLDVDGTVYVDADAPFWSSSVGLESAEAAQVANRWVEVPPSSPVYGPAAADLTMPSLVRDLFGARTYHKGPIRKIDGVRTVEISYTNSGQDAGPVTCYVATGGTHLPVSVDIGGLTLRLGSWGSSEPAPAPTGATPLPPEAPTAPAGGGVVA
jgi:hypothetical protein